MSNFESINFYGARGRTKIRIQISQKEKPVLYLRLDS